MPAPVPSVPRRTAWPTSSSTSCSRAARSSPPTATSTRPPSASAPCSTPSPRTTSSPSTSPPAPSGRSRRRICSPTSWAGRRSTPTSSIASAVWSSRRSPAPTTSRRCSRSTSSTRRRSATIRSGGRCSARRAGAFLVGNLDSLPQNGAVADLFGRFPALPEPPAYDPAPPFDPLLKVERRDSNQSHLRMSYRPSVTVNDPTARAGLTIYSTLLGGSMGSRLFDEIREQRGLAYSVSAFDHALADVPVLQLSAGLDSTKCIEAYRRMREI